MKLTQLAHLALGALVCACATSGPKASAGDVRIFNVYPRSEELPREIGGCQSLGPVAATAPSALTASVPSSADYDPQGLVFFDPEPLLQTIRARAAHKGADVAVVSFHGGLFENKRRTIHGRAFRCGDTPLPAQLGEAVQPAPRKLRPASPTQPPGSSR
jgi:hypothetical protein